MGKIKSQRRYSWTKEQVDYLIANYANVKNSELAITLKKSKHSIATKAFTLGLTKSPECIEWSGSKNPTQYREETNLTADIICFYDRRGIDILHIARDLNCPPKQIEEILNRCKEDGSYEKYRQQENSGIRFDSDSPLFARVPDAGNKRGWRGEY